MGLEDPLCVTGRQVHDVPMASILGVAERLAEFMAGRKYVRGGNRGQTLISYVLLPPLAIRYTPIRETVPPSREGAMQLGFDLQRFEDSSKQNGGK